MPNNNNIKRNAFLNHCLLLMAMFIMLLSATAQAQTTLLYKQQKQVSEDPNRIYDVLEKLPNFPGGLEKFNKFLSRNIRYPAADRQQNIQGKVVTTFVVERNGSLSNIKIVRSPTKAMRDEALRVLSLSPKWVPGRQNGKVVRAYYTMPITFTISK